MVRRLVTAVVCVVVVLAARVWAMAHMPGLEVDPEERFLPTISHLYAWATWPDAWRLQYRPFCGGCTVSGLAAAGLFTFLPDAVWTWRIVPLATTVTLLLAGMSALRGAPRPGVATATWAAALAFPPAVIGRLLDIGWGNHTLCAAAALVARAAADRRRFGAAGVIAGGSLAMGWSGLPFVVFAAMPAVEAGATVAFLAPAVALPVALGLLQQVLIASSPLDVLWSANADVSTGPLAAWRALGMALPVLWGPGPTGWVMLALVAAALVEAVRAGGVGRQVAMASGVWLALYAPGVFPIRTPLSTYTLEHAVRYAIPVQLLGLLAVAWLAGRRGPGVTAVVLLCGLAPWATMSPADRAPDLSALVDRPATRWDAICLMVADGAASRVGLACDGASDRVACEAIVAWRDGWAGERPVDHPSWRAGSAARRAVDLGADDDLLGALGQLAADGVDARALRAASEVGRKPDPERVHELPDTEAGRALAWRMGVDAWWAREPTRALPDATPPGVRLAWVEGRAHARWWLGDAAARAPGWVAEDPALASAWETGLAAARAEASGAAPPCAGG